VKANRDVLLKPLMTEKLSDLQAKENKVAFVVHPDANKVDIRRAVEKRFNVKVDKVATIRMQGKMKRMGRFAGRRPNWKKAVVTLHEGSKIEFFEGK